jgi:pyruvate dehydrogenase E1 component alpha subunit
VIVDGNDVLAVYKATREATARARDGQGPTFIEGKTYRYRGHYEGDPQIYRAREEVEAWRARDPISSFRRRLLGSDQFDEADLSAIEDEVARTLDEAVEFAKAADKPLLEEALYGVYGDTHDGLVF